MSRAALICPFMTTMTPLPMESLSTATRTASTRFRGPSESTSEAGRCAPTKTTGLLVVVVRSRNKRFLPECWSHA